jgi:ribosomal-protein-alanine N-acetyltransferase
MTSLNGAPANATPITVERMRWWHIADVAELEGELFPHDRWSVEQFWSELALPTRSYVVAMDAGTVVGYAGLFALPPQSDVQTIAVRADQQGRGVGNALLVALLDEAERRGAHETLLEVRADNGAAIALYSRHGFERISARRSYYPDGGDADIMRRRSVAT